MVEQYPHIVRVHIPANGGYNPDTGEYEPTGPEQTIEVSARVIPAGSGKRVRKVDGTEVTYNYDIAFPIGTDLPESVALKKIECNEVFPGQLDLIRFHKGQLHSRGWI